MPGMTQTTTRPPTTAVSAATDSEPMLLTTKQAADKLNVGVDWLKKRAQRFEVPHTRLGRYVRFSEDQLREIAVSGAQQVAAVPTGTPGRNSL